MIDLIPFVAALFGAAWRLSFGHDWTTPLGPIPAAPTWFSNHARTFLDLIGAAMAALFVWGAGGDVPVIALAVAGTLVYFSIGNGPLLAGPTDPLIQYIGESIMILVGPAFAFGTALYLMGYHSPVGLAGIFAALAYALCYKPFLPTSTPWNWYAESIMGAAFFGLLAFQF